MTMACLYDRIHQVSKWTIGFYGCIVAGTLLILMGAYVLALIIGVIGSYWCVYMDT